MMVIGSFRSTAGLQSFKVVPGKGDAILGAAPAALCGLARLIAHVDRHGHDEPSRSAAHDVLRCFDLAAPHQHEDAERHVFPRLLASGDDALVQAFQTFYAEHLSIEEGLVFPAARSRCDATTIDAMGREMQQCRRVSP
jgi:hypothetical protein